MDRRAHFRLAGVVPATLQRLRHTSAKIVIHIADAQLPPPVRFLLLYGESQENHELRRDGQLHHQRHTVLEANQNHHQYHRKPLPSRHAQPFQSVLESEKVSRRKSDFADIVRPGLKTGNREKS